MIMNNYDQIQLIIVIFSYLQNITFHFIIKYETCTYYSDLHTATKLMCIYFDLSHHIIKTENITFKTHKVINYLV